MILKEEISDSMHLCDEKEVNDVFCKWMRAAFYKMGSANE